MRGLSLVAVSGVHSSSRCAGLSLSRPLLLRSTSSRRAGSVVVAHGPSCSAACGIFPDQGSHPCPLNWQADSQPLRHQGSPTAAFLYACLPKFLCAHLESQLVGTKWTTEMPSIHTSSWSLPSMQCYFPIIPAHIVLLILRSPITVHFQPLSFCFLF